MQQHKTVAIHQPNFLPWLGYFHKIWVSDVFVFLDDVEYTKNSFINRNKIKTPQGEQWLTVPVIHSGRSRQCISDTRIHNPAKSMKKILGTVQMNYKKAPHYDDYFDEFRDIITKGHSHLTVLNIELNRWLCDKLDIRTQTILSSDLNIREDDATQRLIRICGELGASGYVAGFGGQKYQGEEKFKEAGIALMTSTYSPHEYPQLWGNYIPYMSALDALFNTGPYCKELVRRKNI